jgi:hypothetical protein
MTYISQKSAGQPMTMTRVHSPSTVQFGKYRDGADKIWSTTHYDALDLSKLAGSIKWLWCYVWSMEAAFQIFNRCTQHLWVFWFSGKFPFANFLFGNT